MKATTDLNKEMSETEFTKNFNKNLLKDDLEFYAKTINDDIERVLEHETDIANIHTLQGLQTFLALYMQKINNKVDAI